MNVSADQPEQRPDFPLTWSQAVTLAVVLLAGSWALGQWPIDEWLPRVFHVEGEDLRWVSMGAHYLVAGALPWVLQWMGLAVLLGAVAGGARGVRRVVVAVGTIGPSIVGLVWWIGLAALFWHSDFAETQLCLASYAIQEQWSTLPFGADILFTVFGTLTCPLKLSGPFTMRGIHFALTAISTALSIAWWTWILHKIDRTPPGPRRSWRQLFVPVVGAIVWSAPVGIRALATVLLHLHQLQQLHPLQQ
jgi:hypothetical protein